MQYHFLQSGEVPIKPKQWGNKMTTEFNEKLARVSNISELEELFGEMKEAITAEPWKYVSTMSVSDITGVVRAFVLDEVINTGRMFFIEKEVQAFASRFAIDDGERVDVAEEDGVTIDEVMDISLLPNVSSLQRSVKRHIGFETDYEVFVTRDQVGRMRYARRVAKRNKVASRTLNRQREAFKQALLDILPAKMNELTLDIIKRGADANLTIGLVNEATEAVKAAIEEVK